MTKPSFSFSEAKLNRLFPFYIAVNWQLQVTSCGESLKKLLGLPIEGTFNTYFSVTRPLASIASLTDLQALENQLVELQVNHSQTLRLKGQFEYLEQEDAMLFVGVPWLDSLRQLNSNQLTINDFAIHDHLFDLLYTLQSQEVTNNELKQLVATISSQKEALKKANAAIRDLALFPLQNPDPLVRIDFEGNILSLNPMAKTLHHFVYENTTYSQIDFFKQVVHHINKNEERWIFEAVSEGKNYSFICKTLLQNGYINIYGRDITQQKKNEAALQRLSLVASANKNGVLFIGENKQVLWCNDGFLQLTGYTQNEVLNQSAVQLAQGNCVTNDSLQPLEELLNTKEVFSLEGEHSRKDGSTFWVRVQGQPIYNQLEADAHYFITIEDISAEKVTQQKLQDYEQQMKLALSNVGDNYYEHNFVEATATFSNPNSQFLEFKLDFIEDAANFWFEHTHPDDREMVRTAYYDYINRLVDHHSLEYRMQHEDGSIHWILDRGFIVERDEAGNPIKMVGSHIDITQHKQLEIQLTQAKEAAEASTRAKEAFLANMSHEMRTPMNAITGMAGQLAKTMLDSSQQFYLNTIRSAADNLLQIINDILDISKIEAGKLSLEQIGFEPQAVINQVMRVMMQKAVEKGLLFTNSFNDGNLHDVLIGDPHRLSQVLLNFITNAIKFTEKGKVDISCYVLSDTPSHQTIKFQIQDTGIGMTPVFVQNLFQKFTQEDESVTRRFGGTGLGMSICKQLVELMGGHIDVESEKGKGTTISAVICFAKGTQANLPVKNPSIVNVRAFIGKKILVVDDNEMNRAVAQIILENYGAQITVAVDGKDALAKATTDFDMILMDIQMPEMGGLEATRQIRKKIGKQVPIIALTAMALKSDEEKMRRAGMQGYLFKPFEEIQLITTIAEHLNGQPTTLVDANNQHIVEQPLFNLGKLNSITRGDQVFTQRLLGLFMEQAPAAILTMKKAYQQGNFTLVKKTAHKLIASADNMGIDAVKREIREVEKNATIYQTSPQLESLINHIDDVIKKVLVQLKAYIQ